ncbi:hypothetical protein FOXG_22592 [Fusarium oxysporum f. sp. lycopersici 4287]|uniref:Uncharacterized protein n=1 Tax=Fusarium oxysporum f. sp. lycopersici (strain 4287 / CBS 123668 / FGSC 9935 / NRRL 34936) TaxID=426428 RepID=A0A0J9W8G9_FUSO4|nr:hypothetical protein FOXG_22592 [Fusarium oxysporum f. sp. lycopersici 4287]KNB19529.1 hypothetical protein FOXG_22592 [Fusarium oxysporum f. sp. lycopersici 4287]
MQSAKVKEAHKLQIWRFSGCACDTCCESSVTGECLLGILI